MKKLQRSSVQILVLILAVFLLLGGAGLLWLRTSLPQTEGEITLPGLTAPVTVTRDTHGIPWIEANTQNDAYFALGFVHAQDRLWQMDIMRRTGAGRLSEILGSDMLPRDRLARALGLARLAKAGLEHLSLPMRDSLESYSNGVNAYLATRTGTLPPEFIILSYEPEPWKPVDSLIWGKLMALWLSSNRREELLRSRLATKLNTPLLEDLWMSSQQSGVTKADTGNPGANAATQTAPSNRTSLSFSKLGHLFDGLWTNGLWHASSKPKEFLSASNNWVLSGRHTKSGIPLLANDPHLWMSMPGVWYLARLTTPERDLAGATAPGVPFTVLGHNSHIAWGFTTTHSDTQDFFIERLDPEKPGLYLTPEGPRSFLTRYETISVRGDQDEVLELRETRHGPVISDILEDADIDPGHVLALADPAQRSDDLTAQAIYHLNMARNWREFTAAIKDFHSPQQNIVYADVAGNIGFYAPGRLPLRKDGDGTAPVPGWNGDFDWTGFIPFDQLPHALNPPSGRAVTANQKIVEDGYPHLLSAKWRAPYRARRIHERLSAEEKHDLESMTTIQHDSVSLMARDILPLMLSIKGNDPDSSKALALLQDWDAVMDRNRPEPLIFSSWLEHLQKRIAADELGDLYDDIHRIRPGFLTAVLAGRTFSGHDWCDDGRTVEMETCAYQLILALGDATTALRKAYGNWIETWRWGDAHRLSFSSPLLSRLPLLGTLAATIVETDGGNETVNRGAYKSNESGTIFTHFHGPGMRAVYDLSKLEDSLFMIAPGQSGNVYSHYFNDLVIPWRDGHYVMFPSATNMTGKTVARLYLKPH
tara:strand:+ start:929 stop:3385 length:2457 start_codon:yes stop_codon:yes gene_type:complete